MSKLVLVAAVVAALVAVTVVAEGEAAENYAPFGSTEMQCYRELEESSLEACQQVMHNVVYKVPGQMLRWSPRLHVRCCQQLLGVRRECRHAAIRGLVREYEQQQAMVPPEEGSGETVEQQREQGWYGGQTTQQHQQQQGQGCRGDRLNRKSKVHESSYGCSGQHTAVGRQPAAAAGHEFGETVPQQEGPEYGVPSTPHFSTEQHAAGLRLTKARQFAAQLPVMCRFDQTARPRGRGASSVGLY